MKFLIAEDLAVYVESLEPAERLHFFSGIPYEKSEGLPSGDAVLIDSSGEPIQVFHTLSTPGIGNRVKEFKPDVPRGTKHQEEANAQQGSDGKILG